MHKPTHLFKETFDYESENLKWINTPHFMKSKIISPAEKGQIIELVESMRLPCHTNYVLEEGKNPDPALRFFVYYSEDYLKFRQTVSQIGIYFNVPLELYHGNNGEFFFGRSNALELAVIVHDATKPVDIKR